MADIERVTVDERPFVGVRKKLPVAELQGFFADALPSTFAWLAEAGIAPASPPMAVWVSMDMQSGVADCHAGAFVESPAADDGRITHGSTPACEALTIMHEGPYETVGQSWQAIYAHAAGLGRAPGVGWEIYVDDPEETAPEELRTRIFLHLP